MFDYNVEVVRVVDGDTVELLIDLGFSSFVQETVRLAGVDTPESRTRDAREKRFGLLAKARVQELLPVGKKVVMHSMFYDSRGRYGRALVDFHFEEGPTLGRILLDEHLAVPYRGQNKKEIRKLHEANWDIIEPKSG